jgi:hypothetical protein
MVFAVIREPVTVTTFPASPTPVGGVPVNVPPSELYVQPLMVVLVAVPVITAVVGVVAPPAAGEVNT